VPHRQYEWHLGAKVVEEVVRLLNHRRRLADGSNKPGDEVTCRACQKELSLRSWTAGHFQFVCDAFQKSRLTIGNSKQTGKRQPINSAAAS